MATVAILGGGISGLSCAFYLRTLAKAPIKYIFLLERSPKFGGWIQTTRFPDGAICEHGPRSLRVRTDAGYNALALADEIGLSTEVLSISTQSPASRKRFVFARNELYQLPNSPLDILRKLPLFKKRLFGSVYKDLTTPKSTATDESLFDFTERRFGREVSEYVFDPLCRGICAGDSKEISVRSLLPRMYEMEQKHGSVIKGSLKPGKTGKESMQTQLAFSARHDTWTMWSLKNGLGSFIDALANATESRGICDLHVNAECAKLTFKNNKTIVTVDGDDIEVDHVFSSIPSSKLAPLLTAYPVLSNTLYSIPSVTVAVVYLEYRGFALQHEGFGFLTPSTSDSKLLGVTFDSCCFPDQNGHNRSRLTCMLGGRWFTDIFGSDESATEKVILDTALDELKRCLKITDIPARTKVLIQKDCIPQYLVGHHKKLETISSEIKRHNLNISVFGASYEAAGVPDCIYNAKQAVENYQEKLKNSN